MQRLLGDQGIVRHRGKIEAVIANAKTLRDWRATEGDGVLDATVWTYAEPDRPAPRTVDDIPATSPASIALARDLKARGWRFLGPTTAYAALQAIGVVNDHLADCQARSTTTS